MRLQERLDRLEEAIEHVRAACVRAGVVVEGRRDIEALQELGVGGVHWTVNMRGTVEDLVDALVAEAKDEGWTHVVVLTDWDRTGGRLARRLHDGLVGRTTVDMDARRRLASICQCKCVEHVPSELRGLRAKVDLHR